MFESSAGEIRFQAAYKRAEERRNRNLYNPLVQVTAPTSENATKFRVPKNVKPKETLEGRAERVCRNPGASSYNISRALDAIGSRAEDMSDDELADALNQEI
jgi:hypothetical protein